MGGIRATEYKLSGGWMVLNIESCSEGRKGGREEEEEKEGARQQQQPELDGI